MTLQCDLYPGVLAAVDIHQPRATRSCVAIELPNSTVGLAEIIQDIHHLGSEPLLSEHVYARIKSSVS